MRPICWLRKSGGRGQRDDLSGDHVALHGLRQRGHWQGVQEVGQTFQYSVRQSHSSFGCLLLPGYSFSFEVYFFMPQVWAGCRNCWTVRKQHRLVFESCQQLFYNLILVLILWATTLFQSWVTWSIFHLRWERASAAQVFATARTNRQQQRQQQQQQHPLPSVRDVSMLLLNRNLFL